MRKLHLIKDAVAPYCEVGRPDLIGLWLSEAQIRLTFFTIMCFSFHRLHGSQFVFLGFYLEQVDSCGIYSFIPNGDNSASYPEM